MNIIDPFFLRYLRILPINDVPIFVAAPTEDVAMPAISKGAAAPAVVNVKMPPAIKRYSGVILDLVILANFSNIELLGTVFQRHLSYQWSDFLQRQRHLCQLIL